MHLLVGRRALLLAALLLIVTGWPAAPAQAHEADPRIQRVLDGSAPALPESIVIQAVAGIAAQLVASNPTATVLEVLGTDGRAFLRLSSAGVLADVTSADFLATSNPNGAVPARAASATPRWVQLSAGSSWGWYDHRLHPAQVQLPADQQRAARLAEFSVPLRYGDRPVSLRGHLQLEPLLGAYTVAADPAPKGLVLQALPGKLPGLFLSDPQGVPVQVLGRDGEPFLRVSDRGVEVNVRSRTHVEDRQARGLAVAPPARTPEFALVAPGATSYSWLDTRLAYPAELPGQQVLQAGTPTVLRTWTVPALVGGAATSFTGAVSWVPAPVAAAQVRSPDARTGRSGRWPAALWAAGAALVLGGAALARARGRRAPRRRRR